MCRRAAWSKTGSRRRSYSCQQGALRPTHNLDPFKIEQREYLAAGRRHHHIIAIDADRANRGSVEVVIADAANENIRHAAKSLDFEIGNLIAYRQAVGETSLLNRLVVERGDRDRHVLKILRPLLRCHDDIGNAACICVISLRLSMGRSRETGECRYAGSPKHDAGEFSHESLSPSVPPH